MHRFLILKIKKYPLLFPISILSLSITAICLIYQQKLIAFFINGIIFLDSDLIKYSKLIYIIIIFILVRGISTFYSDILSNTIASKIKSFTRQELLNKFLQKNMNTYIHTGKVVTLLVDKVEAIEDYYSRFLPQVSMSIIIPVFVLIIVFPIDLLSALIFLITAPLIPFFMFLVGKFGEKVTRKQWVSLQNFSIFFLDSIRGIKTIIQFNQRENHLSRIQKANEDYIKKSMAVLRITFLSAFVLELVSTLSIAIIAVEIGLRLLFFQITFEQAFFILLIAPEFYLPLRNLGLRFHAAMKGVEAYKEIFDFLILEIDIEFDRKKMNFQEEIKSIKIDNVSCKYPKTEKDIIKDFSFCFESGKKYAIVGLNGTGKTTLFWLLLKFLEPENGQIFVNEKDLTSISRKDLYTTIGWLPQKPVIFRGTLYENLSISNPMASQEAVSEAIDKVHLNDFIRSLKDRYSTELMDHGVSISSGERQKIGLARILIRDCSLILCDEPTSSLDPKSEEVVVKTLHEFSRNKILLTIAHKLNTIQEADQILFFDHDYPIISGDFHSLLENNHRFNLFITHNYLRFSP